MRLASLCEIQTGYTARTRLEPVAHGGIPAVQLRDLGGVDAFDAAGLQHYALDLTSDRYLVREGDILFRSRGEQNTAIVVSTAPDDAPVALLPLLVLRAHPDLIDTRYLAWFINQPSTQRYFDSCARGTRLRMIPKSCLDNLEVTVPDLETQRLIVEIDLLARRERELMNQLAEKKKDINGFRPA